MDSTVPVAYYYIEYKESDSENWKHWGPIHKETIYLARNLKPGSTYFIRVVAYSILGSGQRTVQPYEFEIPGLGTKNKGEKAVAAGVVGGILFFIAAIVLSVCAVKICNKRKRRKAEKGMCLSSFFILSILSNISSLVLTILSRETFDRDPHHNYIPTPSLTLTFVFSFSVHDGHVSHHGPFRHWSLTWRESSIS